MTNVMIVWELGAGLGHVMRVSALAQAFVARGVRTAVVLRDLADSSLVAWPAETLLLPAPISLRGPMGFAQPATYAEILYASGYHDIRQLDGLVTGWSGLIELVNPDLIVVDHAPTAILAAKLLGIPCVRLGTGFFAPPVQKPFPVFRTWEAIDAERAVTLEHNVLNAINTVVAAAEIRFTSLAEALQPNADLIASWPELDHYAEVRRNDKKVSYIGNETSVGVGIEIPWQGGSGRKRLVAYLKREYTAFKEVLEGLINSDAEVIAYISGVSVDQANAWQTERFKITPVPLALNAMLEHCDGVICHAGSGTVALALEKAVPVFLLPTTAEQLVYANRIDALGFGVIQRDIEVRSQFAEKLNKFLLNSSQFAANISAACKRNGHLFGDAIDKAVALCLQHIEEGART